MPADNGFVKLPSLKEQQQAKEVQRLLAHLRDSERRHLKLRTPCGEESIELPTAAVTLLTRILIEMSDGNAVTLVPVHAELTTSQAADLLNVSRPHFVKLLEEKEIPFIKVGTHRRIRAEDVLRYRENRIVSRRKALEELTGEAERLGLGY